MMILILLLNNKINVEPEKSEGGSNEGEGATLHDWKPTSKSALVKNDHFDDFQNDEDKDDKLIINDQDITNL